MQPNAAIGTNIVLTPKAGTSERRIEDANSDLVQACAEGYKSIEVEKESIGLSGHGHEA